MTQLQNIRQGKNSIYELNTKFRLLVQKAGLDILTNAALLIQMYSEYAKVLHHAIIRNKHYFIQ